MKSLQTMLLLALLLIFHHLGFCQQRELQMTELNTPFKTDLDGIVVFSKELIKDIQLEITAPYQVNKKSYKYEYEEGLRYPLRRSKDGYHLYYDHDQLINGRYKGIGINENDADDIIAVLVSPNGDLVKMKKSSMKDHIKMVETYEVCRECHRKELMYLGLDGNQLKFRFQHFFGILNKVLLEEEVSFSYKKFDILEYQGAQLRIIEASPNSISYEVLESFK